MGFIPKKNSGIVGGAMIDTGWNVVSSVGLLLLPATRVGNMRNVKPVCIQKLKRSSGIGKSTSTVDILKFYFHFGSREYGVDLNIVSGAMPLIISHQDIENMVRNLQTLHKTIDRAEDCYQEKAELKNILPVSHVSKIFFPVNRAIKKYTS